MAKKLGLSESSYIRHENGQVSIDVDFVSQVAHILQVSELKILGKEQKK